ncbi:hypothetical protein [Citrobacter freundii]|uniref:hypothetical protein n=1 Tax=Citrobacter freundii TaxID=546 RepID=UPI0039787629
MKKLFIVAICLFFISACKPEGNNFIKAGEGIVRDKLNDPGDAKFNTEYFKYGDYAAYVCGDVTYGKNKDGNSSFDRFYVYVEIINGKLTSHGSAVIIKEDDKAFLEVYKTLCR